jgi:hypothetical protein
MEEVTRRYARLTRSAHAVTPCCSCLLCPLSASPNRCLCTSAVSIQAGSSKVSSEYAVLLVFVMSIIGESESLPVY